MLIFLAGVISASAEMGAVSDDLAEIRNAPSFSQSFVTILAPLHYPLYIHEAKGDFYMVSDYLNNSGWIEKSKINRTRTVVVNTKNSSLHSGPGSDYPLLFKAQEGVAFKVLRQDGNWVQVENENGMTGWLSLNQVWGE
jgi:uncharacterized protein YgiM (DUF1202 family)